MVNKKGESGETIGLEEMVFLILNLAFFAVLIIFIHNAGSRAFVYEEAYAKQIVGIIDQGKPGMNILLDVSNGLNIGEDNGFQEFIVDDEKNLVTVKLSSNGYSYRYFSDYSVKLELQDNLLLIKIEDSNDGL